MLSAAWLDTTLQIVSWIVVCFLILVGLIGTLLPILPGTFLIFLGAVAHYFFLGPENSIELTGFIILLALLILSFVVDFSSGMVGAKWFGASKWGAAGAIVGGIAGLFFGLLGIVIGPIIGAVVAEIVFAKKKIKPATKSGWGTVIGATAGLVVKVAIAAAMVGWIIFDIAVFSP